MSYYPSPAPKPVRQRIQVTRTGKILLGGAGVFLLLCCGGVTLGAVLVDPPKPTAPGVATTGPAPNRLADEQAGSAPATTAVVPVATTAASPTPAAVPTTVAPTTAAPRPTPTKPAVRKPAAPTKPPVRRTTQAPPPPVVYYANCSEVRAAGAAPIHRGEPGYSRKLDRDGDGVACE